MRPAIRLVTFSGLDGCGKSTQVANVVDHLRRHGYKPVVVWSRGGYTSWMEAAKRALRLLAGRHLPASGHSPARTAYLQRRTISGLWLHAALLDLLRLYGVQFRIWSLLGRPVVCDRYLNDTLVDFKMMFPRIDVERQPLWKLLDRLAPRPDAAFLLELRPDEAERRSLAKGDPFPESIEARKRRAQLYSELSNSGLFHVISGTKTAEEIADLVQATIESRGEPV